MSFRLKTILGIALIELFVMLILIFMNQTHFGGTANSEAYDRGRVTVQLFSSMVTDAVISSDLAGIDSMIDNMLKNDELIYLRVLDNTGTIFSQGGNSEALTQTFIEDANFDSALSDQRIDVFSPIRIHDQDFGRVELGLSTVRVEHGIKLALISNILIAATGMTLVAIFGFLLGSVLTQQLSALRDGARMIEEGNLSHRVPVRGRDELADTALCFNNMAAALATDRAALELQQADLLEKREKTLEVVSVMREIVMGKTLLSVPSQGREDEIGDMARATAVFRNTMEQIVAARREQARLIKAFDQLGEQVAIFDSNERVIFTNAAFRENNRAVIESLPLAFSYNEYLSSGAFQAEGEGRGGWIDAFRDTAQTENGAADLLHKDGSRLLVRETAVENIGMIVIATDITELRSSQAQVVHTSKLATLGEMAAGMAHELNQPLGVIQMAAGNMLRRIEKHGLDEDYATGKLHRISSQTERASKIIDHMRIFARRDTQKTERFYLNNALNDAMTMMRPQFSADGIKLQEFPGGDQLQTRGSKVMFEQVLVNLLANARDAILERSKREDTAISKCVSVSVSAAGKDVQIVISDTGGGIPEDTLARLFEPFFTTKAPGKGTGLGLSISYGIVQDMGGEIQAANTGEGSQFTINVPMAA